MSLNSHFSAKDLSQSERERIARELFDVDSAKGDQLHGLCPFHDETKPSFGYNTKKDVYNCFSCDAAGDLIDLWSHRKGLDKKPGYKAFCEEFDNSGTARTSRKKKKTTSKPSKKPAAKTTTAKIISETAWNALSPLPPDWIKSCVDKFGWSPEIINRFDLRLTVKKDEKRIAIPINDDDGHLRNIRLYLPNAAHKDDKVISWGAGYGSGRLFPTPSQWSPGSAIYLCEGEKDTLCALSHGLNAVTQTCGVKSWKKEHTKYFEGLDVIICYDADKPGLDNAEKRGRELVKVAKSVRIIDWPKFMGLVEKHGQDLTDFFVTHKKNVADFKDLLATAFTITKPIEPDDEAGPRRFFGGPRGGKFYPMRLAQEIMDDVEVISDPEKELIYRWNGQFWEKYELAYLRSKALVMLGEEASSARAYDAANIVRDLAVLTHGRKMNDQPEWICLKNGMFNIRTEELVPFNQDFNASFQIGVEYDPHKEDGYNPLDWFKFLMESIGNGEVIREIQKFFGYCLTRQTRYEKALILLGPGGDGKSTLLDILQAMVGEENCSNISLGTLEDQFYRSCLVDKLVNVSAEIEARAFSSDVFKAIVSGDRISASFKHQTPFDFRPFCKLAFSSNRQPRILDNSDGFFRKVIIVEMKQQFAMKGKADLFLREKLLAELSGIFAWALEGLKLLQDEGFTNPTPIAESLADYRRTNNPVVCFVEDCVEFDTDTWPKRSKAEVYQAYKKYCLGFGYRPQGEVHFGKELHRLLPGLRTGKMSDQSRKNCYVGIFVSDESAPPPPSFGTDHNQGGGDEPQI